MYRFFLLLSLFFVKYTATTAFYMDCHTLSLHDALPISLPKRVQSGAAAHSFGNLAQRGFKLAQAGHFVSDLRHYAALTAVMSIPALNSREGTALVMSHTAPSKLIRS